MKLKSILTVSLLALSATSFAQVWKSDSIAMGVGYANDVYYELNQGSTKLQAGNDWHLSFQTTQFGEPDFNAMIRANHTRSNFIDVFLLNKNAAANYVNIGAADTVGKTAVSQQLNNADTSWGTGAFYTTRNPADPFSFGWGEYSPTLKHSLNGNNVYLLRTPTKAYKFWPQKYVSTPADSARYIFRVALLDGSQDHVVEVWRTGPNKGLANTADLSDRLFAYYNLETDSVTNREPSRQTWDIQFTQYRELVNAGPGGMIPYSLTGVLGNQSMEVADIRQVDINDPVHLNNNNFKTYTYTKYINEIGSDWKTYVNPGPSGYYKMADSTSYFIKTKTDNAYYQLVFTRFDGGGTAGQGKIVFAKQYLGTTVGVKNVANASVNAWFVSPNPANNKASVMIDTKVADANARLLVVDMAGRVVTNTSVKLVQGMNGFELNTANWPAGVYAVQLAGSEFKLSTRLVVAH